MSQLPASGDGSWSTHQALLEASRCLYCHDAPCIKGCPVQIKIPEFIRKIVTENYTGAARVIYANNVLGAVCADVCPQSELCAKECNAQEAGQPINIGGLQKFAVAQGKPKPLDIVSAQGKRVAVIGAGPAGLSGAHALASQGYAVTVFEARATAGGAAEWAIPPYRLERGVLAKDMAHIRELVPDIRFAMAVGEDISPEALLDEYDAILLSCGLGQGRRLDLPGAGLQGVLTAEDMLLQHNSLSHSKSEALPTSGARVVVIGGGNTAMDAACVARRAGAEVTVLYRRSLAEMTAWPTEYAAAGALGVGFRWWTAPMAIIGDDHVLGVRAVTMQPSAEGEPGGQLEVLADSEHEILADFVIIAIGQESNPVGKMLAGKRKVFLAGDVLSGGATVVQAVAEGQQAALAIAKFLGPDSTETEGESIA